MSDTATKSVVDFLRECLDKDEPTARYATTRDAVDNRSPGGWGGWWIGHYHHYARHDPASVLTDIAAKRAILDEYTESASRTVAHGAPSNHEVRTAALADVIQILAEAYADRPGYDESWRPQA